jgi:CubicO group peptidase (beta-lactamase class C family)
VTEDKKKLERLADRAFSPEGGRRTLAFLVVKGGRMLVERYAPGTGADTPHRVYSAGQLLLHALIGNRLLVEPELLKLRPADVFRPWPGALAPELRLEHLLRLSSGIRYPFDREATETLPERELPAAAPRKTPLQERYPELLGVSKYPPNTRYNFSFTDRNLVVYALQEHLGDVSELFHREIGGPLNLGETQFRFNYGAEPALPYPVIDYTAISVRTSARDLRKLLALYLTGGIAGEKRIFPADWAALARTPSPGQAPFTENRDHVSTDTFGLFWHYNGRHPGHGGRFLPGAPEDLMIIRGLKGQFLAVIPSQELIFLRLGDDAVTSPKFSRALLAELLSL